MNKWLRGVWDIITYKGCDIASSRDSKTQIMRYVFHRMSKIHRIYKNWVATESSVLMGRGPHLTLVTSLKGSSPNTIPLWVRASTYEL